MEQLKHFINARAEAALTQAKDHKFDAGRNAISVQDKLLSSIRWELGFTIFFGLACFAGTFASDRLSVILFLLILLIYVTSFTVYLIRIYHKTKNKVLVTGSLRSSIAGTIEIIKNFVTLYTRLSMSFVPAVFFAAFLAGLLEFTRNENLNPTFPWFSLFIGVVMSATWVILMKRFTKWWMRQLYGIYMQNLEADLKELDGEN